MQRRWERWKLITRIRFSVSCYEKKQLHRKHETASRNSAIGWEVLYISKGSKSRYCPVARINSFSKMNLQFCETVVAFFCHSFDSHLVARLRKSVLLTCDAGAHGDGGNHLGQIVCGRAELARSGHPARGLLQWVSDCWGGSGSVRRPRAPLANSPSLWPPTV